MDGGRFLKLGLAVSAASILGVGFLHTGTEHVRADETGAVTLTATPAAVPADDYTELTVQSEPLTGVPERTFFTVETGSGAEATISPWDRRTFLTITDEDQDTTRNGVQLRVAGGMMRVHLRAGTNAGVVPVRLKSDLVHGVSYSGAVSVTLDRHTPFTLTQLTVTPEAPTTTDTVQVTMRGTTPSPSWSITTETPRMYTQDGREVIEIDLTSRRNIDPADVVPQDVKEYTERRMLPPLTRATSYLIRIVQNGTIIKEQDITVYAPKEPTTFTDIDGAYWAYDYIMSLWKEQVISGYEDRTFRPENSITRAELVKMVMRSKGIGTLSGLTNPFSDVPDDAWYRDYILTAEQRGIASGYSTGNAASGSGNGSRQFRPNAPITRAEALKILFRTFDIPTVRVRELNFDDTVGWQNDYVETAVAYDVAHGYGGRVFGPNRPITRAETSKIIDRTRGLRADARMAADTGSGAEVTESGIASYYGDGVAGHLTASGERYDPEALVAAHKTLPFGTVVRVSNDPDNGKTVDVRIIDRGPYVDGRILDLSRTAFEMLAPLWKGVIPVTYRLLETPVE